VFGPAKEHSNNAHFISCLQNMANEKDSTWKLYYWPKLAGRAEFVRVIFEEVGVQFEEINDLGVLVPMFKESKVDGWPCLTPPMIKKGDFQLCQTPVICKFLGKEFGLYPDNANDEIKAEQINVTIHDFIAEGMLAFHGKDFVASYFDQVEETKPYIKRFVDTRLPRFLSYFEKVLQFNNDGNGFVIGNKLTYVDLGLMHVLRATESQFPEAWGSYDNIPKLKAFKERMVARPKLAAYFQSSRCKPFEGNSMM